ncbi:hypothetical protein [Tropicimonas aquimaris]|uniref:Uncharacterized protein n=1 Tax=Tropicimonas aquimaris TaxID=914152 RepID=A0ABW3IJX6_9RHOB
MRILTSGLMAILLVALPSAGMAQGDGRADLLNAEWAQASPDCKEACARPIQSLDGVPPTGKQAVAGGMGGIDYLDDPAIAAERPVSGQDC